VESNFFGTNHELFLDRIHHNDRQMVDAAFSACRNGKSDFNVEYRVLWPDDTIHHLSMMGRAVLDAAGASTGMAGVCRDMTKNKQQEEDCKRLALLEQRQEFVAMLAHDLRTPIFGCQRIMSLMIDGSLGALTDRQIDLLSKISDSNQSMLLMISNVLDSYRCEAGAESLICTELDVHSLVSACLVELAPLAQKNDITLVHKVSKTKKVLADQIAMRRVICNLVSNAVKFTPARGSIEITVLERDSRAILQVRDTGFGMSPEEMTNLFQRFWQAKGQYRSRGLGLGLYLCRHLVEAQSGTISCQSEAGKGTTFEVSLRRQCRLAF
jgi:signal transduction histidine kinase